jgi:hypothetical protein
MRLIRHARIGPRYAPGLFVQRFAILVRAGARSAAAVSSRSGVSSEMSLTGLTPLHSSQVSHLKTKLPSPVEIHIVHGPFTRGRH